MVSHVLFKNCEVLIWFDQSFVGFRSKPFKIIQSLWSSKSLEGLSAKKL